MDSASPKLLSASFDRWAGLAIAVAVACAAASAVGLHTLSSRADAALLVPVFVIWAAAATTALRARRVPLRTVLLVAVAVRLVLVGSPPLLSDDLYRYLWEGEVLLRGGNPFTQPPTSLPGLNDPLRALVNHPEVPSVYPPVALLWFQLLATLGGGVVAVQVATAAIDVGTACALCLADRGRGGSGAAGLVWAAHPLPALESAVGAHLDLLAVACCAWAVVAIRHGRPVAAFLALGTGAGVKLLPALLLPPVLRRTTVARLLPSAAVLIALCLFAVLPLVGGGDPWTGWRAYAGAWSFNGLLFPWLAPTLGEAARPLLLGVGALIVGRAWWTDRPLLELWVVAGAAFVCLSPTVHPWYGVWWLAPALVLRSPAGIVAGGALPTAYAVLSGLDPVSGAWTEPVWLWWLTWVPVLGTLAWSASTRVRTPTSA